MSQKSTLCKFAILWLLLPGLVAPMRLAAQDGFLPHTRKAFRSVAGASYLLQETFNNAAGYDNTWTEVGGGTKDENHTATKIYNNTECLQISASANAPETRVSITTSGATDIYFLIQPTTLPPSTSFKLCRLRNGTSELASVSITTGGALSVIAVGGSAGTTSDVLSTGTTYHVFITHTPGSTATMTVGFSTDGTRPTSGTKYAACTNGSSTSQPDQFTFGSTTSNTGTFLFDNLFIDDATISTAPAP